MSGDTWEYCGRGICAAPEGHEGTCAEASGWDEPFELVPLKTKLTRLIDTEGATR